MAEINITGLAELRAKLLALPAAIGGEILASALGSAATVIQNDAKKRLITAAGSYWLYTGRNSKNRMLVSPGWLKQQVIKKRTLVSPTKAQTIVTVKGKGPLDQAFFWRFIEYGHFSRGAKANATRGWKKAEHISRWVPAHPFMRPAFSSNIQAAIDKFREKIKLKIDQETR